MILRHLLVLAMTVAGLCISHNVSLATVLPNHAIYDATIESISATPGDQGWDFHANTSALDSIVNDGAFNALRINGNNAGIPQSIRAYGLNLTGSWTFDIEQRMANASGNNAGREWHQVVALGGGVSTWFAQEATSGGALVTKDGGGTNNVNPGTLSMPLDFNTEYYTYRTRYDDGTGMYTYSLLDSSNTILGSYTTASIVTSGGWTGGGSFPWNTPADAIWVGNSASTDLDVYIKRMEFTNDVAVPEPSSFVLAALGLAGLGWFGVRRRKG